MRVWDIPPNELCNRHLVGEHAEIHAVWSVITGRKRLRVTPGGQTLARQSSCAGTASFRSCC